MSRKIKVAVSFELESLVALNKDDVADKVSEKLLPQDSDNFFNDSDTYAIFDENSLDISVEDGN